MRKTFLPLLLLGLLCAGAGDSFAQCTCAAEYRDITPLKEFKLADVVFVGKVIEIKESPRDKDNRYVETVKFEVGKAWKQDLERIVTITNTIRGCVKGFEEGEEWLVYAHQRRDGTLGTGCCCSRTGRLAKAAEDLREFEAEGLQPTKIQQP